MRPHYKITSGLIGSVSCITTWQSPSERLMFGKTVNSGQICISPNYVMCDRDTKEKLLAELEVVMKEWYDSNPKASPCMYYDLDSSASHWPNRSNHITINNTQVALVSSSEFKNRNDTWKSLILKIRFSVYVISTILPCCLSCNILQNNIQLLCRANGETLIFVC